MKKTIGLIAGKSGDSLTDALHNEGYQVAIVCGKNNENGIDKAEISLVTDLGNYEQIIDFFIKNKINQVMIGTGHIKAIELSKELEKHGIISSIDYKKSMLAKDKMKFKLKLIELGVVTPAFKYVEKKSMNKCDILDIQYPCVVKSTRDVLYPAKIHNKLDLESRMQEIFALDDDLIIEEFIEGVDCTIPVVNDGENIRSLGIIYWDKSKECGLLGFEKMKNVIKLTEEKTREVEEIAVRIVQEIGFPGAVRVDVIVNSAINVLEVNSVIVISYKSLMHPFFEEMNIDIAEHSVKANLKILEAKKSFKM